MSGIQATRSGHLLRIKGILRPTPPLSVTTHPPPDCPDRVHVMSREMEPTTNAKPGSAPAASSKQGKNKSTFAGEFSGGLAATIVALPSCIAYGLIAFAPLGEHFTDEGIQAGLFGLIIAGLLAAILGAPAVITEPRAPLALVLAAVTAHLMREDLPPDQILILALLVVFMAGALQVFFAMLRLGTLVKFISYPVIAGFLNGAAVLIVGTQVWNLMGVAPHPADLFGELRPLATVVGLTTAIVMWNSKKITTKIHGSILGLLAGSAVHYALSFALGEAYVGAVVGEIPSGLPTPHYAADMLRAEAFVSYAPFLFIASFSLAILGSIESLMTSVAMQSQTGARANANRELLGQGLGGIVASAFGGMSAAAAIGPSQANYGAGGRGRMSGIFSSLIMLAVYLVLGSFVGYLPKAALSGILLVIAAHMFDVWSLQLFKRMTKPRSLLQQPQLWQSGVVILLVMGVTIVSGLVAAVAVGVGVSILMFVVTMSRSVIRRHHDAKHVHSKRQRSAQLMECLEAHGDKIAILELEGAMFFGSADHLANEITRLADGGARYLILDMKRVKDLDITTARLLKQTCVSLEASGRVLGISYLEVDGALALAMREAGLFQVMSDELLFPDTDMALEYFEEQVIAEFGGAGAEHHRVELREVPILQGLNDTEFADFEERVTRSKFTPGEELFHEGDEDRELFLITAGSADVVITLENGRTKRLMTFSAGTVIGEMALLEGQPRSATVVARDGVECYRLSLEVFEAFESSRPRIAVVLLSNLARLLSGRVRTANSMIRELER